MLTSSEEKIYPGEWSERRVHLGMDSPQIEKVF